MALSLPFVGRSVVNLGIIFNAFNVSQYNHNKQFSSKCFVSTNNIKQLDHVRLLRVTQYRIFSVLHERKNMRPGCDKRYHKSKQRKEF